MDSRREFGLVYFEPRRKVSYLQASRGTGRARAFGYWGPRAEYIAVESGQDKSFVFDCGGTRGRRPDISARGRGRSKTEWKGQHEPWREHSTEFDSVPDYASASERRRIGTGARVAGDKQFSMREAAVAGVHLQQLRKPIP